MKASLLQCGTRDVSPLRVRRCLAFYRDDAPGNIRRLGKRARSQHFNHFCLPLSASRDGRRRRGRNSSYPAWTRTRNGGTKIRSVTITPPGNAYHLPQNVYPSRSLSGSPLSRNGLMVRTSAQRLPVYDCCCACHRLATAKVICSNSLARSTPT